MTQLVSVAAMIPVMLPEDLKDYIFLLQHTDVADFLFTALAHGYQNVWGQSLPHSLLSSCNLWSGLEFRDKHFWIWLIHLDHQGFFWFYVFYFILFFFSLQRLQCQLCSMEGHDRKYADLPRLSDQWPLRWETGTVQQVVHAHDREILKICN